MDIYQNNSTGITTPQGRNCNEFFFDVKTDNRLRTYDLIVSFYEREDDALAVSIPNAQRVLSFDITTESTLKDCITNAFENSPYQNGEETIDLSGATVIGSTNGIS